MAQSREERENKKLSEGGGIVGEIYITEYGIKDAPGSDRGEIYINIIKVIDNI